VAALAGKALRGAATDAWWLARPPDKAVVFALHIDLAVFIDWDLERGQMTTHRWSIRSGYEKSHQQLPVAAERVIKSGFEADVLNSAGSTARSAADAVSASGLMSELSFPA
jgi:hypothetical protein